VGDLRRACKPRTGGWRYGSEWGAEEGAEGDGSTMVGACGRAGDNPSEGFVASLFLNNLPKSFFEEVSDDFVDVDPGEVVFEGISMTVGKSPFEGALMDGRRKSMTTSSTSSQE